jgi:hypothetical protein
VLYGAGRHHADVGRRSGCSRFKDTSPHLFRSSHRWRWWHLRDNKAFAGFTKAESRQDDAGTEDWLLANDARKPKGY